MTIFVPKNKRKKENRKAKEKEKNKKTQGHNRLLLQLLVVVVAVGHVLRTFARKSATSCTEAQSGSVSPSDSPMTSAPGV